MKAESVFLRRVADFCCSGSIGHQLADIAFVLPNKRTAMFLKKYMREALTSITMMPRFMTMRTFLDIFADKPEGSDLQLLFTLYDAYCKVLHEHGRQTTTREFDSFIFWGDMMLSDFNDIDKSLVRADAIFKNLRDSKEILADYLDDEQKEIVRRVWGESRLTSCITEFWAHLADDVPESGISRKFLYLWEIMTDIYTEFHRLLDEKHIATAGDQYKTALSSILDREDDGTHYIFVGFNDLTRSETLIFDRLQSTGTATFFWDTSPLALCEGAEGLPTSLRRLSTLAKHFPAPEHFELNAPQEAPSVTVTAVPSNVAQAKAVNNILTEWLENGFINKADPMNTAIIIPEQGLLLPTLMSIPEEISSVNISMGLPFRTTTFAILLNSIISMQLRARERNGLYTFFYSDVIEVLQHPHIRAIASDEADIITKYISDERVYNIAAIEITEKAPRLAKIFAPLHEQDNVRVVRQYLSDMLNYIGKELSGIVADGAPSFELNAIDFFLDEIDKLTVLIERHDIRMANRTFLQLFERVFSSRALTVSGKPLQGLQILGVLETRALDFDNVIFLSMNDGVFPRKQYTKTMIPNNLRRGYGLPDFDSLEWTYSYAFYRLVARAKNVAILYDARAEGKGKGERSRYIAQMEYAMPRLNIVKRQFQVGSQTVAAANFVIEKTPAVMKELAQFKPGGKLKVSTSAIKEYLNCPFSFYLKYVRRMRGSDEMVNYITGADYGTMVHNTLQALFEPFANQLIDAAQYERWLDPANTQIEDYVRRQLLALRRHSEDAKLNAEEEIALEAIAKIVRHDLEAELKAYCKPDFTFIGNEMKVNTLESKSEWKIDDNLSINFYMAIDRVDRIDAKTLRFIDFKTGTEDTVSEGIEGIFKRYESKKRGMFQLLTYCEAYLSLVDKDADIVPNIHAMKELVKGNNIANLKVSGVNITSYVECIRNEFRPMLLALLREIFGPEGSFVQSDNENSCTFCHFASLCGRLKREV